MLRTSLPSLRRMALSIVTTAAVLTLAGCSEDETNGTGPNGGTPEPALNEIVTSPALSSERLGLSFRLNFGC